MSSRGGRPRYSRSRSRSPQYSRRHSRSRSRSYSPRPSGSAAGGGSKHGGGGAGRKGRSASRSPMSSRRRHVGTRENPPESTCLGVFGLSLYTSERDLEKEFSRFGPLQKVQIVLDGKTGRSRGFGFVYFESSDDAKAAKDAMCDQEMDGRRIRVDFSITKRPHTPTPGVYMGRPTRDGDRGDRDYGGGRGGGGRYGGGDRGGGYRGGDRGGDSYYRGDRGGRSPSPYGRRPPRRDRSRSFSPRRDRDDRGDRGDRSWR